MNKIFIAPYLFAALIAICTSCKQNTTDEDSDEAANAITPVTIVHPVAGEMQETVEVNAISTFLLKTYPKATANGYLQNVNIHLGEFVEKGQLLFTIKTKEAQALGNTINTLDSSLHFEGVVNIKAPGNGYITQLAFTESNYVQDGEQLAEITDTKSFVFILNLPYELTKYLPGNRVLKLQLPDSAVLDGYFQSALPSVDSVAQTQQYIVKVNSDKAIPEKLIAKVRLIKGEKVNAVSLPKAAVLSNEVQSEFWVMKMLNDSVAVKVPVQKGMETGEKVEIVSPPLTDSDRIVLTGNYGLADTARVQITKE